MAKLIGAKEHVANLRRIAGPEMERQVFAAMFVAGATVATEAQLSITRGAVSGKAHKPSLPGEPPMNDTGLLANSIEVAGEGAGGDVGGLRVTISSNAPYSRALEYGTSKMQARPFMAPALAAKREEVVMLIRRAVAKVANGGTIWGD